MINLLLTAAIIGLGLNHVSHASFIPPRQDPGFNDQTSLHAFNQITGGCSCRQHVKLGRHVWGNGYFADVEQEWFAKAKEYAAQREKRELELKKRQAIPSPATQVFVGNIVTMANGNETATFEAMAVDANGQIMGVGTMAQVMTIDGASSAAVRNWTGKWIYPGFWDNHNHFLSTGLAYADPNNLLCYYPRIKNLDELNAELSAQAKKLDATTTNKTSPSIFGFGWDLLLQSPFRHLNKADLDAISTTRPVVVIANTAHTGYANTLALKMAGITKDTPPLPGGGEFMKGPDGELNGIFVESAVIFMTNKYLNIPSDTTAAIKGVLQYLSIMAAKGITSIGDGVTGTTLGMQTELGVWLQIIQAQTAAALSTRIVLNPDCAQIANASAIIGALKGVRLGNPQGTVSLTGTVDPMVCVARSKLFLDGSNQSKTAAQTQPYLQAAGGSDVAVYGSLNYQDAQVDKLMALTKSVNFSMQAHVNGDKAGDQFLAAVTRNFVPGGGNATARDYHKFIKRQTTGKFSPVLQGFRNLMIHSTILREDQYDTMLALNVTPTYLEAHVLYWGRSFRDTLLGDPRAANMDAAAWSVARGIPFAAHSDAPVVETPEPLAYISTFVTRLVTQQPGAPYVQNAAQTVSVIEAIKALTIYPAYQMGLEKYVGTLEKGKLADLVVLDQDIRAVDPIAIRDIRVLQTYVSGRAIKAAFNTTTTATTATTSMTMSTQTATRTSGAGQLIVSALALLFLLI